jgi:quinol monooxygenase YgiN
VAYELHRDPEHPGKFMFYERFKSQSALDAHVASAHFKKFLDYRAGNADPVAMTSVTRWRALV